MRVKSHAPPPDRETQQEHPVWSEYALKFARGS